MWRRVLPIVALVLLWAGPAHAVTCPSAISALSPTSCWPLQETSGTTITDTLGVNSGTISGGYTLNQGGGIACNGMTGLGCNITTPTQYTSPQPMSLYVDFSGTQGGLLQFGSTSVLAPTTTYYALYLDNHGKLTFGTDNYGTLTVLQSSQPYADGNEHKAVVTIGPTGMQMYVDGQKVASNGITLANYASGYWFLGGINTANWQLSPALSNFNGTLTTIAWWNGTQLTDAQGITATGGNPTAISNSYCTFTNQIASLNPATAMAFANKRLTFTTTSLQNRSSSSSSLPLGPSTEVCQTDASGNILAGCQVPQGAHVNLSVGNGPAIPLVIPLSTSCDLTAIMLSQTDPPEVVSAVAVAGPLFAGATVTNPPAGTIGTATITAPAAYTVSTGSPVTLDIGTNGNVQAVTLTASTTVTLSNFASGANFIVDIIEGGAGGFSPTFAVPAGWTLAWPAGGSQPAMPSTAAGSHTLWEFVAEGTTVLAGSVINPSNGGAFPLTATANFNNYSATNVNTLNAVQLSAPTGLGVSVTCGGGCGTTYTYEVTCLGDNSTETTPTGTVTAVNNATLDGTHYNTLTWTPNSTCHGGYNVYGRISGSLGKLGTTTSATFTDNSMTAVGAAPPTTNTTGVYNGGLGALTTTGDMLYENTSLTSARLAGNTAQLANPTFGNSNVTNVGTTGSTTYTYYVVCNDAFGGKTLPSSAGVTTTGNATLNSTNYNQITLPSELGCVSWDVLKTDTGHSIALAQTGPTVNDQGGASSVYSTPTSNSTALRKFVSSKPDATDAPTAPTYQQPSVNDVAGFDNVTVTGIPAAGQLLVASNAAAASWSGVIGPATIQWNSNTDLAESNAPRSTWTGFLSGNPDTNNTVFGEYNNTKPVHIRAVACWATTPPSGCGTSPILEIEFGTIRQPATSCTLADLTNDCAVGGLSLAVPAATAVHWVVQTAEAGCGTKAANINCTMEFTTD